MEKTNELNKFLSYIHMGNSIYRIYYEEAKNQNDYSLMNEISYISEKFKSHEEIITKLINDMGEEATNSLTAAGILGVYKEKIKNFESSYSIIISALKSINMGMISAIKFLKENKKLSKKIKQLIKGIINDYIEIQSRLVNYIINV